MYKWRTYVHFIKINGKRTLLVYYFWWQKIIEHQEEINKINVFLVPDGDTGSNLAATVTSIIHNSKESDLINIVASSVGDAALDGARGNSGVILAQFLYGIGIEVKDSENPSYWIRYLFNLSLSTSIPRPGPSKGRIHPSLTLKGSTQISSS